MINKYLISQGIPIKKLDQEQRIEEFIAKIGDISEPHMDLSKADSETLMKAGDFLGMNLLTGTNLISTLVNTTVNIPKQIGNLKNKVLGKSKRYETRTKQLKLNYGPLEFFKRKFLSYQINKQLTKIRKQDQVIKSQGTEQIPKNHLS